MNRCTTLTEKTTIQVKKEFSSNKNVQVPQLDQKHTSVPSGAVAVVNDKYEIKEIDEGEATLEPSMKDPMKEETEVYFEDKNTDDKREFPADGPQCEKANELNQAEALDGSSLIREEDGEQEKLVEECTLEIAGSEEVKSLALTGDISIKRSDPSG